jgi:hypothetical protein
MDQDASFSEYLTEGEVLSPEDQLREEIEAAITQQERLADLIHSKTQARLAAVIALFLLVLVFAAIVTELLNPSSSLQLRQLVPAGGVLVLFGMYQTCLLLWEEDRQLRRLGRLIDRITGAIIDAREAVDHSEARGATNPSYG